MSDSKRKLVRGYPDWETLHAKPGESEGPFFRIIPYDRSERRSLWMRFPPNSPDLRVFEPHLVSEVELRAGREGDDTRVLLHEGEVLTCEKIAALIDVMLSARWAFDIDDEFKEVVDEA